VNRLISGRGGLAKRRKDEKRGEACASGFAVIFSLLASPSLLVHQACPPEIEMKKVLVIVSLFSVSLMVAGLIFSGQCYSKIDLETVVGLWLLDDGKGNIAKDFSPNGNNASFNGNPEWVAGKFDKAISFDGIDDYLSVEDSDSLDVGGEAITLLAWIRGDDWPASWNHVIRKTPENPRIYILGVHSTGLPFTFLKTDVQQYSDIQGTKPLPTKAWIHLAMIYNGEEIAIYVNGEADVAMPASGVIEASDGELRIGRGAPGGYFTGIIDEVGIFRVALSQDEIKAIMNNGLSVFLPVKPQGKLTNTWGSIKALAN